MSYSNTMPQKVDFQPITEIKAVGVVGFMKRQVTPYGTGAKVTCLKEYLGKTVYLIVTDEPWIPREGRSGGQRSEPQK
jgi:putative transposon-encoded protein